MNATVRKSAVKDGSGKTGDKGTPKGAVQPKRDAALKSKVSPAKTAGGEKAGSARAKPVLKNAGTATSSSAPAAPLKTKAASRPAPAGAGGNTKFEATSGHLPPPAEKAPPEQRDADVSSNKAKPNSPDTMGKTLVPKASEVATKTAKSTPAVPADGSLLTEEQILQMSDKDYMNEAQLAFFRARLQQLERDLLKNAGETTEHLRETVLVPDPADRATIEEEHALELRTRDRERKLLKKVQQAIASIDGGDYGWCEETGEPIGIPRLLARPTATLSLEAQQRRELKQKLYGD